MLTKQQESAPIFKNNPMYVGDKRLFPVHLQGDELRLIVERLLLHESTDSESKVKALVRKDKGGKGIDFRIDIYTKDGRTLIKDRRYSFGVNSNWEVNDMFDHWIFNRRGGESIMDKVWDPQYSAEEILERLDLGIENILEKRLHLNKTPQTNPFFRDDNWVCVYQN